MRRLILAALVVATAIATVAAAQAALLKPDAMIKARQGLMEAVAFQASNLSDVAKGNAPLTPATAEAAANIAALAHALKTMYGPGTEALPGSNAKPEVFSNNATFLAGYDKLADQATKVEAAAKSGDLAQFKAAMGALGQVCGGCHKQFRAG